MESSIRVRTTPNIIGKAFKEDNEFTVKLFEAQDFNDPEPNLSDDEWLKKYGDKDHTYYVVIRHPETKNYLREDHIYSSWGTVIGTLRRMINQHNKKVTNPILKVGDTIEIISMAGDHNEPRYNRRKGTIYMIDKYGMCYGDWEGTFPVDPKRDEYKIINSKEQTNECKV